MADKSSLDQIKILSADELTAAGIKLSGQPSLAQELARNDYESERRSVQDTAVGIYDTLQSISTLALAPLPGIGLEDIGRMSSELDQFRSPAYLAERQRDAQRVADLTQAEGEWAGFKESVATTLQGGNLAPDALAQIPYLAIGPVARVMGSTAAMAVPGVVGRAVAAVGGTSQSAVVNRIAALSGLLEGAGGYSQTYERAISEGLSPEEAEAQAEKAGLAAAVMGTVLGKLTPAFELDPLGIKRGGVTTQFLGDAVAPTLTAVAGEAVEEGGIAITNTVADNILAGKDPMEGVGGAVGQAVAISSVFTGGMRTPGLVLDTSKAVGTGVRKGLEALAARATTPEIASVAAASAANAEEVIQSTAAPAADAAPPATDNIEPSSDNIDVAAATPPVERRRDTARRKAIDELSPEEKDAEIQRLRNAVDNPVDATTGLIRSDTADEESNTPVARALNTAVETSDQQESHFMSFDVANLGGLNEAVNNVAAEANVHYRALVDIAKAALAEVGLTAQGFRTGGDEFGMVVQGSQEAVDAATTLINERVSAYTQENNLDTIPNPKGKAPGLQLHVGATQIVPGDTVDTIRNRADRQLDAAKKGRANVGREQTETPRETPQDTRSQEDGGTRGEAGSTVSGPVEEAQAQAQVKKRKPLQYKLPLRASRRKRKKSNSELIEAVLVDADTDAVIESTTGAEQAAALARKEELAPVVEKATAAVEKMTDESIAARVEQAKEGDEQAQLVVEAVGRTDITRLPDEVIAEEDQPVVKVLRDLKDTKINDTSNQILEEGFSGTKNSRGVRGYLQGILNHARTVGDTQNEAATNLARFVAHLAKRANAFQEALNQPGDVVEVAGTKTRDAEGKLTEKPFIIRKNNQNSMAVVNRVLEDAARAQNALAIAKQRFPEMFKGTEEAPVADASPTPTATARVAPVAEELSLVEEENTPPPTQEDFTDNAPGEEGLFPDQYKMPNSTRFESETGLIDVDMTGDVWQITNTFTPEAARKSGAGRARMLMVARMAAEAGKQLNGDNSVHPSALRMNLRMIDAGLITAEFDRAAVEAAIENNSTLRRDDGVFRNIKPVEETPAQAATAPTTESVTPAPVETNPLMDETGWISPAFMTAFEVDPEASIGKTLEGLSVEDQQKLRAAAKSVLKALNSVLTAGIEKNAAKLEEALTKPWGVWAHAWVKEGDGYAVQQQLRQAFAIAAALHMFRAPSRYDETTIIQDGEVNRAATPHAWAREIARDAMLLLGVKPNTRESETITQGLMLSLGLSSVQALVNDNNATVEKVQMADGRTFNVLMPTPEMAQEATKRETLGFVDRVNQAIKGEREFGASLEPVTEVAQRVNYSQTPTSDSQKTSLNNRNNVPHFLNPTLAKFLGKIGENGIRRLLMGALPRNDMPPAVQEILEAQQRGIDLEIAALNHYSDLLGDNVEQALYWEYGMSINGRTVSKLGPQGYKILRDLFSSAKASLNLNEKSQFDALKMTIAQALGAKTDIQSPAAVLEDYKKLAELWGEKAIALVDALESGEKVYPLLERAEAYSPRELNGLLTLGQLLKYEQQHKLKRPVDGRIFKLNAPEFVSFLPFEIDGKTNGAFNTEMLYGLAEIVPVNLEQGGLFLGKSGTTWGEEFANMVTKYGNKDLYERVARRAIPVLHANWAKLLKKFPGLASSIKENETLLILSGMLAPDGKSFLREASKTASNPIVYGAGVGGVANQLKSDMKLNLVTEWLKLDYMVSKDPTNAKLRLERDKYAHWLGVDESTWDYTAKAAAEALLEAYRSEKPVVTAVTGLMVKITNLGYAVKKAQWDSQHNKALTAAERNKDLTEKQAKWALSRAEYQRINGNTLSMTFSTAASDVGVNLDDVENQPDAFRVGGLGTSFQASLDLPQPSVPGVRILALLTQAAGDGAMGNEFLQQFRAVTDVYDGIEFKVNEFMQGGQGLNAAVWKTLQHDVLQDFVTVSERILNDIANIGETEQNLILEAYNSTIPNEKHHLTSWKQFLGEVGTVDRKIREAHTAQKEGLAKLKSQPNTVLQMGGGEGYTTDVVTRDNVRQPDFRLNWNKAVGAVFELNNGKLDRTNIIAMMDGVKWKNPIQKLVWNRLRKLLPAGVTISLAKNQAEWEAFGLTNRPYGTVNGVARGDQIYMATASPAIMLHELFHSVFSTTLNQYFANINQVPVELRGPINDLVQLLNRFKSLSGIEVERVQAIIRRHEFVGDTARAIDELMAYSLTETTLLNELSPGFASRVINRIKQVLWGLIGKDVPSSYLDEVLTVFENLSGDLETDVVETTEIRDHVNPLENLTASAFAALAQKIARGQRYKTPPANTSHLTEVMQKYSLTADQQMLYNRVYTLLRMETRPAELEQFVSTTLSSHPDANLFNGAKDVVASVMALAAVEPSFKAQLESIALQQQGVPTIANQLIEKALGTSSLTSVDEMLSRTFSEMIQDSEYKMSLLGTVLKRGDRLGNTWLEKIGEKSYQAAQGAPRGVSDVLNGIYALTTETGSTAFGRTLITAVNEFTDQRWLQDLMAALVGSQDDTNTVYRQVNTMKSNIAQTRSMFTTTLPLQLRNLFPESFDGWNNLFKHFGRLDVSVLGESAAEMYSDDAARRRMITALKSKVSNWRDAENLGHYMAHGKVVPGSTLPLLRNARAIADDLNGRKRVASDSLVADVDQLATLFAIEFLNESDRTRIAGYYAQHPDAMSHLSGMLKKINEEDAKQYRNEYRYTYWKGNLPLTTDPRTSIVLAGTVKGAALEALGYTRGKKYVQTAGDPATDMYYYTRKYAPPPVFTQGILNTVQQTAMGINYTTAATITPEVGTMITSPRLVRYIQNNQGRDSTLVPVFNFDGDIVAYERLLDRKLVQEVTNGENTMLHLAIGSKLGRIMEERLATRFNQAAINILVQQWEKGKAEGEEAQYEAVNSTSDKQVARAWEVIPAVTKRALEDAFGGEVMIRKDLIANTLGYHKVGVGDVFTGDASLSDTARKAMYGLAQTLMGPGAAKILYAAESAIKEGVGTARDFIIVRSLSVAINNAMASMHLVLANGVPIGELIKSYREGMRDVRAYGRLQKEIIELTVKIAGATGDERQRLRTLQDGKREAIRRLAIYPLIEAGELNDLPEGLTETPSHTYLGDFSGWLNNHLKKIHPKAPMAVANLAIAKDSEFHDALSKAIQAGDFLGRWAVYKHMVKSGATPEVARDVVRDEFVSYTTNPGRFRGALEDYGLVWWTQFTIRAQKVLLRRFRRNPFSFFVSQLGADVAGSVGPLDGSITERGWDNSTGLDQAIGSPSAHIWAKVF